MQSYLGVLAPLLLIAMVLTRIALLRRRGIAAMKFGQLDKSDFLIPPFAFLYFYTILAGAFGWPTLARNNPTDATVVGWLGVLSCAFALLVMFWSLVSFGTSFRVGIDVDHPDNLITTGVFAYSRNPIYVAFAFMLFGELLIQPNWVTLVYVVAGTVLFDRQVMREEAFMLEHYGDEYRAYCTRVRRYL
jgi:protein-S-isoprenylcysteine O-methyltransferase Ste14